MFYKNNIKHILDRFTAGVLLFLLFPVLFLVAIFIKIETPGPLFFTQKRVGKDLSEFRIFKFRTMTDEKREVTKITAYSDGVTAVGKYLRRFKIDEIPQLINVVKGEMSLVGPRPSIKEHLEQMTEEEKRRYSVRPGLTGLAQVSGNIYLSWKDRYKFDQFYVENISFINDLKILLRTILIVINGEEKYVDNPLNISDLSNG